MQSIFASILNNIVMPDDVFEKKMRHSTRTAVVFFDVLQYCMENEPCRTSFLFVMQ
jgi:hypothetical protein